ncbi:bidirectional sugar transporter SWEET5-like [Salvia miltiorrhiza]|uniref:bidirectional sugar transporter SWEET5-like n=1 Tax=Salvia miltiorrhiza TaxID=226208 RepID=UPI0025AD52C0|nr:bidirectional sugar transporter SWEET5-like [Salvia miltiorrhiza]XP_057806255.1 bidirectional sugar transporter SWEET5-like [Salvia miltiorrhiza]
MTIDAETARTIVGIIGNFISFGLFLSPGPTFYKIWQEKSVQHFKPDPYLVTVLNCMMWCLYGMPSVHPDSLLVVTINGIGFFIEIAYVTIFFIYSNTWPKRRKILLYLFVETIFFIVIVFITMFCLHGTKNRSMLVGIICIVMNIGMYTSPLTIMKRVIKTKSVKFMPFYLSIANFANGTIWSIYALIKFDSYVLIPNGLGAISGLVQLILYGCYYKSTNWDEDDSSHQSEMELNDGPNKA